MNVLKIHSLTVGNNVMLHYNSGKICTDVQNHQQVIFFVSCNTKHKQMSIETSLQIFLARADLYLSLSMGDRRKTIFYNVKFENDKTIKTQTSNQTRFPNYSEKKLSQGYHAKTVKI